MLMALNANSASQSKATKNTAAAIVHLLDYAATHPDAILRYNHSDMVFYIHSAPEAHSCAGGENKRSFSITKRPFLVTHFDVLKPPLLVI
jgi:hypothetical protein